MPVALEIAQISPARCAECQILKDDVAGDPRGGARWTRRTTRKIAEELRALGIQVSARKVASLLSEPAEGATHFAEVALLRHPVREGATRCAPGQAWGRRKVM